MPEDDIASLRRGDEIDLMRGGDEEIGEKALGLEAEKVAMGREVLSL